VRTIITLKLKKNKITKIYKKKIIKTIGKSIRSEESKYRKINKTSIKKKFIKINHIQSNFQNYKEIKMYPLLNPKTLDFVVFIKKPRKDFGKPFKVTTFAGAKG
jgi:hypothetical protein